MTAGATSAAIAARCAGSALLAVALAGGAAAQGDAGFPALFRVTGVAADDVLNIRAAPGAGAEVIGSLSPGATGVEVTGLDPSGRWARVAAGERSGWAARAYLAPVDGPPWWTLMQPLTCRGTEPFWSLALNAPVFSAVLSTPGGSEQRFLPEVLWPGDGFRPVAAAGLVAGGAERPEAVDGVLVVRGEACSDGMSDRVYGLSATLLLPAGDAPYAAPSLAGCCTLGR